MLWRRFAFQVKDKGMETFYNALVKREPVLLEEDHFRLEVDNQIQVDYINAHIQDLIGFIRKETKNYFIQIQVEITTEQQQEDVKFLTGKDKFAALARKNPSLHTLKTVFNLDIEF